MKRDLNKLLETIVAISYTKDLDSLLERVLLEARQFVNADAGTLYLKAKDRLFFSYVQNSTLFSSEEASYRYVYSGSVAIDRSSLAGYVAATGDPVLIDDVYDIQSDVSYSFNPEYDTRTSYRTKSMLIVPLMTRGQTNVGVLQLINAKDDHGDVISFSGQDLLYITQYAQNAASAIEQAKLNREMVLRMVEISELRDPFETSQHAKRVGSYAVELYEKWAVSQHTKESEIKANREILRTAAMLHDVGKVAISDAILKKKGDLTAAERAKMRLHTIYGARLFKHTDSAWDKMAMEVVLNHHECWDGSGYPGIIDNIFARKIRLGRGKRGNEIPIFARIVMIADVYDSLVSRRSYKEPWEQQQVVDYLKWQAGKQFDPVLVELFLNMQDVVQAIKNKYSY
ncbi:MAG: HD domain-containing protein [Spirochaetales bacterium]|nr:HD domain-containing protein [Spirochaetales bacterium]